MAEVEGILNGRPLTINNGVQSYDSESDYDPFVTSIAFKFAARSLR